MPTGERSRQPAMKPARNTGSSKAEPIAPTTGTNKASASATTRYMMKKTIQICGLLANSRKPAATQLSPRVAFPAITNGCLNG